MDTSDGFNLENKNLKVNVYTSLVALSVLLVTWIVASQSLKLKSFGKRIDKIPGPFSVPILGTLVLIVIPRSEILEVLVRWTKKFKQGCFRLWLLNEPVVFISSPDHVQKILGSKEHVEKTELYNVLKPLIGNGLITADVPSWKAHRRLLINSVNGKMVNIFMGVCNQTLGTFHDILSKEPSIVNFDEEPTQRTNLHPFINRLAFDIICETIFGISKETLKNSSTYYLNVSHKNKTVMSNRWFSPWLRWKWVWAIHPLKQYENDVKAAVNELFDFVVTERRRLRQLDHDINTNEIDPESSALKSHKHIGRGALIDTLLDAAENEENGITDEYIKSELMTFLVAGHDTSSETILWTLFMLGSYPEHQEKVNNELKEIFGSNRNPDLTLDDLSRLTYLDQCVKETLRIYPSVPLLMRKVNTDVEMEPDLIIPAGTDVALCIPAIHQNPLIYKDPKKFDPERFAPDKIADIHPYAYCPFSLGPRNCIGKRLGEVLTKIVLARLFLNYSVASIQKPEEVKIVAEVTLGPSKPIFFYVKKR
ncbi:unnamed protein product [Orchesella dallaii]|uniref:Cytochrome P450 4C1 n=1 Tax=Orchesella dallaii TaxID=48710 RepID=A0ABP1Q567_9HEXA